MDELIDILDSEGNATGKTAMKSEAHQMGWFHETVHIWFYTSDGRVLLQQRGKGKDTHPLLWDVSVAGHIRAGETMELSALREVEEEIGLSISEKELEKIGVYKSVQKHREDLVDCEFHHAFLCELKIPLEHLRKQESEVEALKLISLLQFSEETWGMANLKKYVPHEVSYYTEIIKAIKERL
ncbi:NUDIX domain-containing protein [Maribacter algarum]|uniref:NUDIX domain-containing protein n=1 Tax=Maribacter algarum (ex Zhang et al. 2020) TaxID=2578118 RepID=A0A5S3Q9C4_9FLAO|nr:NUDIX domain-containing protein [Maribacter algarum]TMM53643.1 NUDIX domain-containing protein [Maribacter algarum]